MQNVKTDGVRQRRTDRRHGGRRDGEQGSRQVDNSCALFIVILARYLDTWRTASSPPPTRGSPCPAWRPWPRCSSPAQAAPTQTGISQTQSSREYLTIWTFLYFINIGLNMIILFSSYLSQSHGVRDGCWEVQESLRGI